MSGCSVWAPAPSASSAVPEPVGGPAPTVSLPYSTFVRLQRAVLPNDGRGASLLGARADFTLDGDGPGAVLAGRFHVMAVGDGPVSFICFETEGAVVREFSSRPVGGATLASSDAGPVVTVHRRGTVVVDVVADVPVVDGLVRFRPLPVALATISLTEGRGFVVRGGGDALLRDGRRQWFLAPPADGKARTTVDVLYHPGGGAVDLCRPQVARVASLVSVSDDALLFRSVIEGAGRSEDGGRFALRLPPGARDVVVTGDGAFAGPADEREASETCEVALDRSAPSPWRVTVSGAVPVTTGEADVDFQPPGPPPDDLAGHTDIGRRNLWRGGVVALAEVGPRKFDTTSTVANLPGAWWQGCDRDELRHVADLVAYDGIPRRMLEYRARRPVLPLHVDALPPARHGRRRVIAEVAADTVVEGGLDAGQPVDRVRTTVSYRLTAGTGPLRVRMPERAQVQSCSIEGTAVQPRMDDGAYVIRPPAMRPAVVAVQYVQTTTPPTGSLGEFDLALPAVDVPTLSTEWEIELPTDHEVFDVETTMSTSVERPAFFLQRLGSRVIDGVAAGGASVVSVMVALRDRLTGPRSSVAPSAVTTRPATPAVPSMGTARSESPSAPPLPTVAAAFVTARFEPTTLVLRDAFSGASLRPAPESADGPASSAPTDESSGRWQATPRTAVVRSVSRAFVAPLWITAFLLGLLVFTYAWMVANGEPPVPATQVVPAAVVSFVGFDHWFPFATSGAGCSFFLLTGGLGLFRLTMYVERVMRMAQLRQLALQEAGTIGDLEGQNVFFATREKRNILKLADLFDDDDGDGGDEGIMFFTPDDGKKGGERP